MFVKIEILRPPRAFEYELCQLRLEGDAHRLSAGGAFVFPRESIGQLIRLITYIEFAIIQAVRVPSLYLLGLPFLLLPVDGRHSVPLGAVVLVEPHLVAALHLHMYLVAGLKLEAPLGGFRDAQLGCVAQYAGGGEPALLPAEWQHLLLRGDAANFDRYFALLIARLLPGCRLVPSFAAARGQQQGQAAKRKH